MCRCGRGRRRYRKKAARSCEPFSIPCVRDRVVQGALKLIVEPIFEADFQPGSFGYRPKRSAQHAVIRVADAIAMGKTHVIDLDLRSRETYGLSMSGNSWPS